MLVCMRTTMNLPDGLAEQVRARAAASGRTTTSLVEEALRMLLDAPSSPAPRGPLPAFGRPDGRFLVDLRDRDAVWAALDEGP
jgi:hypothetical protein